MAQKFETSAIQQLHNVGLAAGEQVIGADHLVSLVEQLPTKVTTEEASTTSY